jgi:3-mercaptopyruvate sulfurtransferase SseA
MPPLSIISVTLIIGFLFFKHLANRGIAQVNAETAREMIKDPGIAALDIRTPPEYRGGHIKGAIPIPLA